MNERLRCEDGTLPCDVIRDAAATQVEQRTKHFFDTLPPVGLCTLTPPDP
jgi:hypothetical protein